MTDQPAPKKPRKRKDKGPFSDELLDELLTHLKGHDAERFAANQFTIMFGDRFTLSEAQL